MSQYNLRNPAVKRLMKEAEELHEATDEYHAQPLEDNLFEWHFTIKGPPNSDFEGGIYHGRITLPPDYPMKPPSIILLTPNGRFETNKKICLSISGYHPESWQPSWSIRTALLAIIGFMPTHGNGALGSLDYTPAERKQLASKSHEFKCPECGLVKDIFSKKDSSVNKDGIPLQETIPDSPPNDVPDLLSENVVETANTTSAVFGKTLREYASENSHLVKDTNNGDEKHLLVHRHTGYKNKVISDETSHIEKICDNEKKCSNMTVAPPEQGHSFLYLGLIFCIVFMLTLLFLRRIYVIN